MPVRPPPLRALVLAALLPALSACVPGAADLAATRLPQSPTDCSADPSGGCFFRNAPVVTEGPPRRLSGRLLPFQSVARTVDFVDGRARLWQAPRGTLTDGASIPLLFVPLVGAPRSPEFLNAAALHDAHCGIGNEDGPVFHGDTWQNVHSMFHDALVAGGTPPAKAKVMFAAVWLGGPRWYPSGRTDSRMETLPDALRIEALRRTRQFIEVNSPPLPQLIDFLEAEEARMFQIAARDGSGDGTVPALPDEDPPQGSIGTVGGGAGGVPVEDEGQDPGEDGGSTGGGGGLGGCGEQGANQGTGCTGGGKGGTGTDGGTAGGDGTSGEGATAG